MDIDNITGMAIAGKKRKVCKRGAHENIPVICRFRFVENSNEWENVVCKKCQLVEGFQKDNDYLEKYCDECL